jgi:hypothetical protein
VAKTELISSREGSRHFGGRHTALMRHSLDTYVPFFNTPTGPNFAARLGGGAKASKL